VIASDVAAVLDRAAGSGFDGALVQLKGATPSVRATLSSRRGLDLPPDLAGRSIAYLHYTSRSRRLAAHSQVGRLRGALQMLAAQPWLHGSRFLHLGPLAHGSGSKLLPILLTGGANVVPPGPGIASALEFGRRAGAEVTFLAPSALAQSVADDVAWENAAFLRVLEVAGSLCAAGLVEAITSRFTGTFVQSFGSCELPHPLFMLELAAAPTTRQLGSLGYPAPGVLARVRDEDGSVDQRGTGRLEVLTDKGFAGYVDARGHLHPADRSSDGWVAMDDVVELGPDGLARWLARSDQLGGRVRPAPERIVADRVEVLDVLAHEDGGRPRGVVEAVPTPGQSIDVAGARAALIAAGWREWDVSSVPRFHLAGGYKAAAGARARGPTTEDAHEEGMPR
jgi:acyl-CoA synthetase (AMP-forming)/AMP-acid ligase II